VQYRYSSLSGLSLIVPPPTPMTSEVNFKKI
jgi:hypothetical protein